MQGSLHKINFKISLFFLYNQKVFFSLFSNKIHSCLNICIIKFVTSLGNIWQIYSEKFCFFFNRIHLFDKKYCWEHLLYVKQYFKYLGFIHKQNRQRFLFLWKLHFRDWKQQLISTKILQFMIQPKNCRKEKKQSLI